MNFRHPQSTFADPKYLSVEIPLALKSSGEKTALTPDKAFSVVTKLIDKTKFVLWNPQLVYDEYKQMLDSQSLPFSNCWAGVSNTANPSTRYTGCHANPPTNPMMNRKWWVSNVFANSVVLNIPSKFKIKSSIPSFYPDIDFDALLNWKLTDLCPWIQPGSFSYSVQDTPVPQWFSDWLPNMWYYPSAWKVVPTVGEFIAYWKKELDTHWSTNIPYEYMKHLFFEAILNIAICRAEYNCIWFDGPEPLYCRDTNYTTGNSTYAMRDCYYVRFPYYTNTDAYGTQFYKVRDSENGFKATVTSPTGEAWYTFMTHSSETDITQLRSTVSSTTLASYFLAVPTFSVYDQVVDHGHYYNANQYNRCSTVDKFGKANGVYMATMTSKFFFDTLTSIKDLYHPHTGSTQCMRKLEWPANPTTRVEDRLIRSDLGFNQKWTNHVVNTDLPKRAISREFSPSTLADYPSAVEECEMDLISDDWFNDGSTFAYTNAAYAPHITNEKLSRISIQNVLEMNDYQFRQFVDSGSVHRGAVTQVLLKDLQLSSEALENLSTKFSALGSLSTEIISGGINENMLTSQNTPRVLSTYAETMNSSLFSFANELPEDHYTFRELKSDILRAFSTSISDPFRTLQVTLESIASAIDIRVQKKVRRLALLGVVDIKLSRLPDITKYLAPILSGLGSIFNRMVSSIGTLLVSFLKNAATTIVSTVSIVENVYKIFEVISTGTMIQEGKVFNDGHQNFIPFLLPKDVIPKASDAYKPDWFGTNTPYPIVRVDDEEFTLYLKKVDFSVATGTRIRSIIENTTLSDLDKLCSLIANIETSGVKYLPSPSANGVAAGLVAAQISLSTLVALKNSSLLSGTIAAITAATTIAVSTSISAANYLTTAQKNPHTQYLADREDYEYITSQNDFTKAINIPLNSVFSIPYSAPYKAWLISKEAAAIAAGFATAASVAYITSRLVMCVQKRIEAKRLAKSIATDQDITINGVKVPVNGFGKSQLKRHVITSLSGKYTGNLDFIAANIAQSAKDFALSAINNLKSGVGKLFGVNASPIDALPLSLDKTNDGIRDLKDESKDIKAKLIANEQIANETSQNLLSTKEAVSSANALAATNFAAITASLASSSINEGNMIKLMKIILSKLGY